MSAARKAHLARRNRALHRWAALAVLLPFLVILSSGILLQAKRWIPSIQPAPQKSRVGKLAEIQVVSTWNEILAAAQSVPEAQVSGWGEIKTIDVRPALGVARVRAKNGYEVQVDLGSGKVLSAAPRYTGLLMEIHEGGFFGPWIRDGVFLPTALLLALLTLTGAWLGLRHYLIRLRTT